MSVLKRLLWGFTMRETAMFGLGMALTGWATSETTNGLWMGYIGLLMVAMSGIGYWQIQKHGESNE